MPTLSTSLVKICPLCQNEAKETYHGMSGYVEGTSYNVFECSNCFTSFVDPMLNLKEEYEIIYGGDDTKEGSYDYYYYLARGTKQIKKPLSVLKNFSAVFWGVIEALEKSNVPKDGKILEVGSGLGYLTYALNQEGYQAEGLDYSETAVAYAKKLYSNKHSSGTIEDFSQENKNKYDAVIATEVIEHVTDPAGFVASNLAVLKNGGTLILTTPIKDIHPKGTIWETEPAPVHLWWFTEKGIAAIAKKLDASVSFVDFTPYTSSKIWWAHIGTPHVAPAGAPVVTKDRKFIHEKKTSYKTHLMKVLPPSLYMRLVCLYHDLTFLKKKKPSSKYMYGMCAVITKKA